MKVIVLRNNFLEGLTIVERAVGANTNLPVLKSVHIRTEEGRILLSATDLELAIRSTVSGKVVEGGECVVPFNVLNTIVKNVPAERLTLEEKERKLLISTDNYEAVIQGQSPKDFPIIPSIQNAEQSLVLSSKEFRDALTAVTVAVQYSEIRPEISGVLFRLENRRVILVGTDSFRLVETSFPIEKSSGLETFSMIIPLKTAEDLLRILDGQNESIEITSDSNQALFRTPTRQITSRLIDGAFPEYQAVIPKETQSDAEVDREELLGAVRLTATFAGRTQGITVSVGDSKKFIELSSADTTLGENQYRVPIKLRGEKFSAILNWRYLMDGLKIYKSEEITIGISPERPAIIRTSSEPFLLYVLMPIKL